MTLRHPYCRTCGSIVKSSSVCNYCGCDPLKGTNFCCDCGTSTIAGAIMCVQCGASFQTKFPAIIAILISIIIAVTIVGTVYFITQSGNEAVENNAYPVTKIKRDSSGVRAFPGKKNESAKMITNTIPLKFLKTRSSAISRLVKNLPKLEKPEIIITKPDVVVPKPSLQKNKEVITTHEESTGPVSGKVSMNSFSAREMRSYGAGCTYFEGRSKNNILFFTTNVYGYVKINGKVYALQGVQKGNDIARFVGAGYEVTIEIEGLAGSDKEWLADATMIVKDVRQRTLSRHRIFSNCIDF